MGAISDFIRHHYRHFNGAALVDAADAYVKGGSTATNYGTATTLWLRTDTGTANDGEAYLRFDYSGVGGPISSARLAPIALTSSASIAP